MSNDRGIGYDGEKAEKKENKVGIKTNHLLVIGINNYSNGIPTLNNAVRDAQAFEQLMASKYGVKKCTSLYNEQASLEGIIHAFDQIQQELTKEDNLIIYFSGHGELVHNKGYWIPVDAVKDKRHTYLSNHNVKDLLKDVKAHHVLAIVDACFSGALLVKHKSVSVSRYYAMPSRWVMTSGQVKPVPDGAPGEHSPFAKSLLTQLEYNPKPYLSLSELWVNMREGITANSTQTPACEAVRDADHQGGEYYFIDKNASSLPPIPTTTVKTGSDRIITTEPVIEVPKEKPILIGLAAIKKEVQRLLIADEAKAALELLLEKLDDGSSNMSTVIHTLSRINSIEKRIMQGVVSNDNANMEQARIKVAIDYLIKNLEEEDIAK